jgi:hypothetical protein
MRYFDGAVVSDPVQKLGSEIFDRSDWETVVAKKHKKEDDLGQIWRLVATM